MINMKHKNFVNGESVTQRDLSSKMFCSKQTKTSWGKTRSRPNENKTKIVEEKKPQSRTMPLWSKLQKHLNRLIGKKKVTYYASAVVVCDDQNNSLHIALTNEAHQKITWQPSNSKFILTLRTSSCDIYSIRYQLFTSPNCRNLTTADKIFKIVMWT